MNRYKNLVSFKPLRNNFKALGLAIVLVIAFAGVYSLAKSPQVHAACQPSGTTYGTDTLTSTVSSSGTYNLWVRMETPSTTANSIMLEVDGGNCYVMGGSATITPNTWTWVNYASGITGSPIQIPLSGGTTNNSHTFKFYGTSSG